ncbi:MAG: anthranilate phosphoribosyltransferase [Alphaproteobacteria bacterium]|nr:MAG: anthranilate phosphoribosyltransferase [Alphaproteobacteria bacterium]
MAEDFKSYVARVAEGASLSAEESAQAFDIMMSGEATPVQMAAFLMALRVRGETVEEITGAARTMRAKATPVEAPEDAVDTCGTGGDAKGTYNISTCTAFIVAGAGVPVAKHGNRSVSSKSGSADVLAALGVNLDIPPETVARCIREAGVGFMFAPAHHSAMRHVGPVRAELGIRTIFNLLGPLANPAGVKRQVIGVFSRDWVVPLAEVCEQLGSEHVWVVHGSDGLDELTTTGPTFVAELRDGRVSSYEVVPADAGLPQAAPADLLGDDAQANATAIRDVLEGKASPLRDIAVLNAAAALIVGGKAEGLKQGAELAAEAIDSGAARTALEKLVEISQG